MTSKKPTHFAGGPGDPLHPVEIPPYERASPFSPTPSKKPRKAKASPVRKFDVTVTELREIADALDEFASSVEDAVETTLFSVATRIRATRERIAPLDEFPRRPGPSLSERAFDRGYDLGRSEGAATGSEP